MNEFVWVASHVGLWLIVVLEGAFLIGVLRVLGIMHQRLEQLGRQAEPAGFGPDDQLPDGTFVTLAGGEVRLASLWEGGKLLLFFVTPGCLACRDALRLLAVALPEVVADGWRTCVVCKGRPNLAGFLLQDAQLPESVPFALIDEEDRSRFPAVQTPTLFTVDARGRIRDAVAGPLNEERFRHIVFGHKVPVHA